eukprot:1191931-Prorocentrum_minimum.AAC.5
MCIRDSYWSIWLRSLLNVAVLLHFRSCASELYAAVTEILAEDESAKLTASGHPPPPEPEPRKLQPTRCAPPGVALACRV